MTSDGKYNGFGILYEASYTNEDHDMIYVGHWQNNTRHGHGFHIVASTWQVKMKGWYSNGMLSSRIPSDLSLCPKFNLVDVFFNKPKNKVELDPEENINIIT